MATTAIFAEILIIGLQALALVVVLILTIGGELAIGSDLDRWVPLVVLVVLALAYVLGVLLDRLADTAFKHLGLVQRVELPAGVGRMRLTVMKESAGLSTFLEYQRSRLRIARATVLNLAAAVVLVPVYLAVRQPLSLAHSVAVVAVLLALLGASVVAARLIDRAHMKRLRDAYLLVVGAVDERPVVAAVCYRGTGSAIEFLLVSTKSGAHWTFPKGHVQPGESRRAAARREAAEEAGVSGRISKQPFTSYLYAKSGADPDVVQAFLLEVTGLDEPTEGSRQRRWCSAEQAIAELGTGRSHRYAREHAAVVARALDELCEARLGSQ